jgi:hypothetical protein
MLTPNDLNLIRDVIKEETPIIVKQMIHSETPGIVTSIVQKELKPIKKDLKKIRKDLEYAVGFLDRDHLSLEKRVCKIEDHLHLIPE